MDFSFRSQVKDFIILKKPTICSEKQKLNLLIWFLEQIVENVWEKLNLALNAFLLLVLEAKWRMFESIKKSENWSESGQNKTSWADF